MRILSLLLFFAFIANINLIGQDPHRFDEEIKRFDKLSIPAGEDLVVFTGSSSIRFWKNLDVDCQEMKVINTGFGGSHMSDLLYFLDQTVLRFRPSKVYIYEGDNDIVAAKDPVAILETTKQVVDKLLKSNPDIEIYLISAKPSPSRWRWKDQYLAFNTLLEGYCDGHSQLFYVDVWTPMLDDNSRPMSDIFVSDSLHMNRGGYLLWRDVMCK